MITMTMTMDDYWADNYYYDMNMMINLVDHIHIHIDMDH